MIKLSSYSSYGKKSPWEEMETETANWQKKPQLPRHIGSLESQTHSHSQTLSRYQPIACPIVSERSPSDVAWDILKYQLSDRPSRPKHLENLRDNLKHRLVMAKTAGNEDLVQILQEEFRALEASH